LLRGKGQPVWVRLPGTGPEKAWAAADWRLAVDLREALVGRKPWRPLAEKLRRQRFGPLGPHLGAAGGLPAVRHLIVLPSTYLQDVPAEVIAPKGCTVSYAPSGTLLAHLRSQPRAAGRGLLALADPVFGPARKGKPGPLPPGGLLLDAVVPGGVGEKAELR